MNEHKLSIHTHMYNTALMGDFNGVKKLFEQGADINMAIIGSTKELKNTVDSPIAKERKKIASWALENGACLIFGIPNDNKHTISTRQDGKGESFFSRVSMIKGPGDVKKGSFGEFLEEKK